MLDSRRRSQSRAPLLPALALLASALAAPAAVTQSEARGGEAATAVVHRDLVYAERSEKNKLDLYIPLRGGPFPLIVMVHGGGWAGDDKKDGGPLQVAEMKRLPALGYAVASINYRLSGEATFPAPIHDVKGAIRWLRAHADGYRLDPRRIALWGASAGGHLAALAALSSKDADLEDLAMGNAGTSSDVQALITVNGPSDLLRLDGQALEAGCPLFRGGYDAPGSYTSRLMGCDVTQPDCRRSTLKANPVRYVTKDDPPVLILQGTKDCAVAPGQARILWSALSTAGVNVTLHWVEGAEHGGPEYTAAATLDAVSRFLDRTLGSPK
jgi:acetyl esterase/lipase